MNTESDFKILNKLYKKLTYFDEYFGSIVIVIILTFLLIVSCAYCYAMMYKKEIVSDWPNQRCKPYFIPIAGLINKPSNMSFSDYTSQNFTYCTQNILSSIVGDALAPITFVITMLIDVYNDILDGINDIRGMFNKVRTFFQTIFQEIMGRLMNIMIPLQQIIIGFKDLIGKVQGSMTAGLYTLFGSYLALNSLLGAIGEFLVIILIAMAVMIALFWLIPFTWGTAISLTAIFIAISIPLAILLVFMQDVLHIQVGGSLPTLQPPSIKCFDKDTLLTMHDGSKQQIHTIQPGDKLLNNNVVTAIIKVMTEGSQMFELDGIIVSDSHIVKYNETWVPVSKHPSAKPIHSYEPRYLYCLNTSSKIIKIDSHIFTDWDEIVGNDIERVKNNEFRKLINNEEIHTFLDSGFIDTTQINLTNGVTKNIKDVKIFDILENGERIYGIVKINGKDVFNQYKYTLGDFVFEGGANLNICDKENGDLKTLFLINESQQSIQQEKHTFLYHLLTDKKTFKVKDVLFYDYNSAIDIFLEKQ